MITRCAIIAGAGTFPFHVAQESRRQGVANVIGIGLQGWADSALAAHVDLYEEIPIGQLSQLIARLKALQVRHAVMAGKVTKEVLFDPRVQFDAVAVEVIRSVKDYSVNSLLGAIGVRLAREGITLIDSSTFLTNNLCPAAVLTTRQPTPEEIEDIRIGSLAARQIALMDIGQTVIVKRRVIVAVEALEGTDAAMQRAQQLAGEGCVVVKMASPEQDRRFDLPILGPRTIEVAAEAGIACLAVQARVTLLLDREALIARADAAGLCLAGVEPPAADSLPASGA